MYPFSDLKLSSHLQEILEFTSLITVCPVTRDASVAMGVEKVIQTRRNQLIMKLRLQVMVDQPYLGRSFYLGPFEATRPFSGWIIRCGVCA